MLSRRSFLASIAAGSALAAAPVLAPPAEASLSRALSLDELTAKSRSCVLATAVLAESRWESVGGRQRIVTYSRVLVDKTLAGQTEEREVLVRTLGGTVGDIGQIVHGEALLAQGQRTVLFLSAKPGPTRVAAMAQGHYPVRGNNRDEGRTRLRLSPRLGKLLDADSKSAAVLLRNLPLENADALIRQSFARRQSR